MNHSFSIYLFALTCQPCEVDEKQFHDNDLQQAIQIVCRCRKGNEFSALIWLTILKILSTDSRKNDVSNFIEIGQKVLNFGNEIDKRLILTSA